MPTNIYIARCSGVSHITLHFPHNSIFTTTSFAIYWNFWCFSFYFCSVFASHQIKYTQCISSMNWMNHTHSKPLDTACEVVINSVIKKCDYILRKTSSVTTIILYLIKKCYEKFSSTTLNVSHEIGRLSENNIRRNHTLVKLKMSFMIFHKQKRKEGIWHRWARKSSLFCLGLEA